MRSQAATFRPRPSSDVIRALAASWMLAIPACTSHAASAIDGGTLVVDGRRRFVLGLYETPADSAEAARLAECGFNLARAGTRADLDRLAAAGLGGWITLPLDVADERAAEELRASVNILRDHPALWIWEAPDELLWNASYGRFQDRDRSWAEIQQAVAARPEGDERGRFEELGRRARRLQATGRYREAEPLYHELVSALNLAPSPSLAECPAAADAALARARQGCAVMRAADSQHPIWFNHAPRNEMADLRAFGALADAVGCDIYPVPLHPQVGHSDLADRTLSCVGAYTRRMDASAPGKAVWMVLQGFGWKDLGHGDDAMRRPTQAELRFMVRDAIVHGADGILFWGTHYIERDSMLRADVEIVVGELARWEPFLASPHPTAVAVHSDRNANSDEAGVIARAWASEGDVLVLVVNENAGAVAFDVSGLDRFNSRALRAVNSGEDDAISIAEGRFRFGLGGSSSALLTTVNPTAS